MGGASGGQSSSASYGQSFNLSDAFSLANSFNNSNSQSQSGSYVDPTQAGYLQNLWSSAQGAANPGAATAAATKLNAGIMPGLQSAFKSTSALTDPTKQIAAQAASLKAGLGDLFRTEINPAIRTDAIGAGGFGGGRQGVAEGVAAGQLADTYAASLGDITANANNTALSAANQAGSLGSIIQNLGMLPTTAGLGQLSTLASILGDPTVLQQALATSTSKGGSTSKSGATSQGGSQNWSKAGEQHFGFSFGR
ncbi:MAG: hypothetical protein QM699_06825 [Amaricoccus sp.]|uniref:hypothetical protein n=1 Tax=Amaricoccus sp. TaxID=1872485 RepID=UPI0039E5F4F4